MAVSHHQMRTCILPEFYKAGCWCSQFLTVVFISSSLPDLASSDFSSLWFNERVTEAEMLWWWWRITTAIRNWPNQQPAKFYKSGIHAFNQKMEHSHWKRCSNSLLVTQINIHQRHMSQRVQWPKQCDNNNKVEDNSPRNSDKY